jgi:hypothetical protein
MDCQEYREKDPACPQHRRPPRIRIQLQIGWVSYYFIYINICRYTNFYLQAHLSFYFRFLIF